MPAGASSQLNLQMAICEYTPKGDSFQIYPRNLSRPVTDAVYQAWKSTGYRNIFDYDAKPENRRLRFAVLDVPSGAVGSVDVPAHPHRVWQHSCRWRRTRAARRVIEFRAFGAAGRWRRHRASDACRLPRVQRRVEHARLERRQRDLPR